jgi:ABC-type Mn2+/Zn2+ transport system ATPase subunit
MSAFLASRPLDLLGAKTILGVIPMINGSPPADGHASDLARLAGASMRFGDVIALAPTDLTIVASSSIALVGANGSGKSTMLKLLAGLHSPSEGRVWRADGVGVAFVAQQHGHHRWLPLMVEEVLRMGTYRGRPLVQRIGRAQRAELDAIADRLEIADLRRRAFGALSGGQRQRVLVAQALIGSPRLLLLDEPITGLDLASQHSILTVIGEEVARGSAVVYSTHHLEEARRAEGVVLLAGEVVAAGAPSDVLRAELLAQAFGGRLLRLDERTAVLVDDHGHGVHDGSDHDHIDGAHHLPAEELPNEGFR